MRIHFAGSPHVLKGCTPLAEFPSLSWLAPDRREAESGLLDLVAGVAEDMERSGKNSRLTRGAPIPGDSMSEFPRRCIVGWSLRPKLREFP